MSNVLEGSIFLSAVIGLSFSWHPCNLEHCYKEPNRICLSPSISSKPRYCDLSMNWKYSCRTHACGYVMDFSRSGNVVDNELNGSITALRRLDLAPRAFKITKPPTDSLCWSYFVFPAKFTYLYFKTSQKYIKARKNANISLEYKTFQQISGSYTVSIPCVKQKEKYPSLARRDAILYIFNEGKKIVNTEYKIEWLATTEKRNLTTSWSQIEIFREASIDPADFTTTPKPTTAERTTTSTTTTTTTTKTTTTVTTTSTSTSISSASTTTRPLYVEAAQEPLKKVSNELRENQVETEENDFPDEKTLEESSEKTINITDDLVEIIKEENINLDPDVAISYIEVVSETTNNIVSEENAETWSKLEEDRTEMLNEIIENADNVSKVIVDSIIPQNLTEIKVVKKENVAVVLVPTKTEEPVILSPSNNVEIGLSSSTVTSLSQDSTIVLATSVRSGAQICYDDIHPADVDIVEREDNVVKNVEPNPVAKSTLPFQIISEIVSVNIKPKPKNNEIKLVFRHLYNISENENYTIYCAYINKTSGRWTNLNCNITDSNRTHTSIVSNHLTNFAILMQIVDFEISEQHLRNLGLITYIGCSISIFSLVLSLCVFALVKNALRGPGGNIRGHRTERYHLHANLALGMLLGQVTFLAGAGYPPGTDSCKATAILLHFFYLSAFSWMLVEGLHLYNLVVKVFRSADSKLGYYYMVGWGGPLLICVISVASAFEGYGEVSNCWLDIEKTGVIWAFVGPVLLIILVNIFILVRVAIIITTLAKSQDNCLKCMTDRATVVICAKAITVLMPILGVTWIFGVLAVNEDTIVFQYMFAIFNSLQGFFLFMFHCVFNSETRASLIYRTKSMRTDLNSRSATNSKSRRPTKVELVRNAEQAPSSETERILNTRNTADTGSAQFRRKDRHRVNPSFSEETPTSSSKSSSENSSTSQSRGSSQASMRIQTRRVHPNFNRAW